MNPIDINNWKLTAGEDDEYLLGTIEPQGYLAFDTSLALSNDGDEIMLFDSDDILVDEVVYGNKGGAPLPPYGSSTARSPNGVDTDDFARDWNVDQTPTQGGPNDGPGTNLGSSIIINEQNGYSPGGDFYELFNPTANPVDLSGWQASDGDNIENLAGVISPGDFLLFFPDLNISSSDVMYLWDANGIRIDQLGRDGKYEEESFQRIPDGIGPNDGFNFVSSGGGVTYFDCIATPNEPNGIYGCFDDIPIQLTIPEIQGNDRRSTYEGQYVTTSGIVTLINKYGDSFWMQDPVGDGDPSTSDGIYVYKGSDGSVQVGDLITVYDHVSEYTYWNSPNDLPLTEFSYPAAVEIGTRSNPLPAPVLLNDLPDFSIPEGELYWESLEGMLVSVDNAPVVSATSKYGEFAVLAKTDAKPGSGFYPETQQIFVQNLGDDIVDYNPERILVDDGTIFDAIQVMPGDRMRSLVGVVDYNYGNYKLQPVSYDVKNHGLPNLPASNRSGGFGDTIITTFNVENLFDLEDNPDKDDQGSTPTSEELDTQLTKLALAIQFELDLPEIIVVQEVENTEILQVLGDRVNAVSSTNYVATSFETSDARGIEVGFLWDVNRVGIINAFQLSGPDVETAFGPNSPSPGREPLAGVFNIEGSHVTIIGNHFKSKGGDDPLFGVNQPSIRYTEDQRKMQAQVVRDFVDTILNTDPGALVMVTGDLNDFQFGEPGEGSDHPIAILEGVNGEVPLTNLVNLEKDDECFTYLYDGNTQVLDHMLISPGLYNLFVAVDALHFNAGYPASLGDDPSNPLRSSDHDPLEGRFRFIH